MKTSFSNEIATVPRKAKAKSDDIDFSYECTIPLVEVPEPVLSDEERKFSAAKRVLPVTVGVDHPTYDIWVKRFKTGLPACWLKFLQKWEEVKTQLNLTTGPELYANFKTRGWNGRLTSKIPDSVTFPFTGPLDGLITIETITR